MEILLLIVRKLAKGRFHYYISIMHNHRSLIFSTNQLLILPHVSLICISFQSQCFEISALLKLISWCISHHKELGSNNYKAARLHTDPTRVHAYIEPDHMMIILVLVMSNTFWILSHNMKTSFRLKYTLRLMSHHIKAWVDLHKIPWPI